MLSVNCQSGWWTCHPAGLLSKNFTSMQRAYHIYVGNARGVTHPAGKCEGHTRVWARVTHYCNRPITDYEHLYGCARANDADSLRHSVIRHALLVKVIMCYTVQFCTNPDVWETTSRVDICISDLEPPTCISTSKVSYIHPTMSN